MLKLYTREKTVSLNEDGLLAIYGGDGENEGQLWLYSTFDLGLSHITPELLLALLGHMESANPTGTEELDASLVRNCFRVNVSCRYLLEYISKLQDRILDLERDLHQYPPPSAVKVLDDIYLVGKLYLTRVGKWVHVGPNLDVIKLAANGTIPKVDLPKNVKSFSSAGEWQRRVAEYCSDSES